MNEHHRKDDDKIELMYRTLFGEKETGEKGMVEKVDDIHKVFVKMENGFSFLKWIIGAVIVTGILVSTVKGWILSAAHFLISTK